jgi:hypothetical protein
MGMLDRHDLDDLALQGLSSEGASVNDHIAHRKHLTHVLIS